MGVFRLHLLVSAPSKNILTGFLLRVAEGVQNSDDMYQTTPNDTCLDEVCFNCYHRCVSLILALRVEYPSLQSREEKLVDSLVASSKETL